jgi:hypothetical protein
LAAQGATASTKVQRSSHHNRWRGFWLVVPATTAYEKKKSAEALSLLFGRFR